MGSSFYKFNTIFSLNTFHFLFLYFPRNGINDVNAQQEADAVTRAGWWANATGSWSFSNGGESNIACGASSSDTFSSSTAASSMRFYISENGGYYMNENGEKNDYRFSFIDERHVSVSSVRIPTASGQKILQSGIYA